MYYDNKVCFNHDEFIKTQDSAIYIAELSDGSTVFQDDNRPNLEPHAWLRLKNHCEENNLYIIDLKLRFRSHLEQIEQANGYCLVKSVLGSWASNKRTFHYYKIGKHYSGDTLILDKWKIPELILEETEERLINEEIISLNYIKGYVEK